MLRRGLAAAGALLLGGCAFSPQLAEVAVDHNRMVAQSTDEQTLLNVVRASYRFPLHFTAITTVNGDVSVNAGAELGVSLDPRVDPQSTGASAGIGSRPSFSASVLAGENFQRGIQTPISPELVAYYLSEGWRDSLLMALLIERVRVQGGDDIINEGTNGSTFANLLCHYEMVPDSAPPPAPRVIASLDQVLGLNALGSAQARLAAVAQLAELLDSESIGVVGDSLALRSEVPPVGVALRKLAQPRCGGANPVAGDGVPVPLFRSTLGAIYFTGEYRRARTPYTIPVCEPDCHTAARELYQRPLIAIRQGEGRAVLATEFQGQRYYIAADELDTEDETKARTMQVLTLIQQLINLQKSAEELPSAINLRTVN